MKKILLLFGLFGFSLTYGQQLANFYLEPTINPNTVTLHTTVYHFNLAYYLEHTVDIQGNEVNFNLCYSNTYFTSGTYDQKEFNINLPSGFSEFIFNMNFFTWDEFGLCDYNNPLDNSSFQFDFPYTPMETTSIPDDNFEGYLELKGFGDDVANNHLVFKHRFLNLSHLWMDEHDLNQMGLSQIESLSGIENLYRLKEIWCQNNLIEHFDVTMHPLAERLWLSGNPLNEINVSNSPNLLILNAAQTAVENVDLTNNPYLKVLSLGSLNINYIDITQNPDLFDLDLIGTSIESIDLSNNLLLRSINISNNPFLESVLIENNDELNYIYIDTNDSLESIVFINTPALDNINCSENASLTNLDVLGCENLRVLVTQSNPNLTSLDLSGNPILETLAITENNLNSLDLRNGNTTTLTLVLAMDNPYLYCVEVDDPTSAPYGQWLFDNEVKYSSDCSLGIEENPFSTDVILSPNPTESVLHFNTEFRPLKVEIFDFLGKKILSHKHLNLSINVEGLETGLYFVKFYFENVVISKRFTKK
ncbi:MAG: hypothetical protein CMC14_11700 [Flavobacteriaceae bacterium]|mgnify:CR=1 FL=1|nr:hypothetical protein [Flavobacteriaceae bacterium]|tara:strand:- start:44890 stop:46491 length:1602 start_codon:yes stop_codon:yes gene_type:complete